MCLTDLQDEADDSNAPHVRLQANRLIADHLRGYKFGCAVHYHQRLIVLWKRGKQSQNIQNGPSGGKLENLQSLLLEMAPPALPLQLAVFICYKMVTADIKEFSYETPILSSRAVGEVNDCVDLKYAVKIR